MRLLIGPDTDWQDAVGELATEHARRADRRGEVTSAAAAQSFAVRRLDPALRAARLGHTVEWDPPAALTSIQARWTCTRCGATLIVAADGTMYVSATAPCEEGSCH
jgi:hypothetical protein